MAGKKVDVGVIVGMALGVFILFTILNAIYGTVNTSIQSMNHSMTCTDEPYHNCTGGVGAYATAGTLVVTGWTIFGYLFGLGILVLAGAWLVKKAQTM